MLFRTISNRHSGLRRSRRGAVLTLAGVGMLAASCTSIDEVGAPPDRSADLPTIVATTSIWADVVTNVACDGLAVVDTVVPIGADPHAFEPSLADRGDMEAAVLVVANGLGLEEGLDDTLGAVDDSGTPVFRIAEHVPTIAYSADDQPAEEPDDGDGDGYREGDDPHVWFDPLRVSGVLPLLAERLTADAGLDATAVQRCLDTYQSELGALDSEIAAMVAEVPGRNRKLVTSHDSLGYFADRYGFDVIGTVIPAPSGLAETNPAQLEELALVIERERVPAIFAESQHSDSDAEALADRVGDVEVVTLLTGTLDEPGSTADTYVGFLRTNARLITTALQ